MSDMNKYYSEIQKYEIININDGEKYGSLLNNDIIIDQHGNFKYLVINNRKNNGLFLKNSYSFSQIPWKNVKKIGTKTIIIEVDDINKDIIDPDFIY